MSDTFNWNDHPVVNTPSEKASSGDFNWNDHPVVPSGPGLIESALNGVAQVGKKIDSYTGAPTRAAISAAQNGDFLGAIPAFANQFGGNPDNAPTGHDIALKAGLSDKHYPGMTAEQQKAFDDQNNLVNPGVPNKPLSAYQDAQTWSPADMGGAAIGIAADPTLALPLIGESKIAGNALKGVSELGGKVAEAAKGISPAEIGFPLVENKAAIETAAKNLGIKDVPKALITSNPTYQQLESGLSQSGSLPAKGIRDQYNNFFKSIDAASEKIASLKSSDSDFATGKGLQSDLSANVAGKQAPVSEMYKALQPVMKKVEVNDSVVNRAFGVLRRNPVFQSKDGLAMLDEYQATAKAQGDLNSLKEWRSTLSDSLGNNSTPLDERRIDAIRDAVTSIRDNSINSLKESLPANWTNKKAALDDLIDHIQVADSAHASNLNDINSVKGLIGNKDFKSPSTFLSKLGDMKEADIAQRAANLDVQSFKNLQEKFPSVFEKAKAAKINDMIQSSTGVGDKFNETSFLKKYQGLDQEMKDVLFDPKMQEHIDSLNTIKGAIPSKLGPSGTPGGQMMMDMLNPKRNALDFGIKKALQSAAPSAKAAESSTPKSDLLGKLLKLVPPTPSLNSAVGAQSALKVADNLKGPDKWANDGAKKLISHAPDDAETIEKAKGAMSDKQVKQLLIQASDLKVGTPAMTKVMTKLKSRLASGDD